MIKSAPVIAINQGDRECLEKLLEDLPEHVRAGELKAIAVALVHADDDMSTQWAISGGVLIGGLMGAAAMLAHRLAHRIDDEE